jgi:hypothetical protein
MPARPAMVSVSLSVEMASPGESTVDVAPADRCHAHLVIGATQEARKSIKERHLAACGKPHTHAYEILFGDIALQ